MYQGLILFRGALYGVALCACDFARGFAGAWSLSIILYRKTKKGYYGCI